MLGAGCGFRGLYMANCTSVVLTQSTSTYCPFEDVISVQILAQSLG